MSRRAFLALSQILLLAVVCSGQLVTRVSNYSVSLGETVQLTCSVTAEGYDIGRNHTLNTTLSKVSGQPVTVLNRTSTTDGVDTYNESLTLAVSSFEDEGEYMCRSIVTDSSDGRQLEETSISFYLNLMNQALVVTVPEAINVTLGSSAVIVCTTRLDGEIEWRRNEEREFQFNDRITQSATQIIITNVTYADIGTYTCAVINNATEIGVAFTTLTVADYRPPFTEGTIGIGSVIIATSSEEPFVECSVSGRPGPSVVFWVRQVGVMEVRVPRELNGSETGPIVDEQGRLNVQRATESDSGLYTCIGVDVAGANASQTINVRINDEREFFLWTQWYMILVYCIVGVAIVVLIVLAIWFCYATRKSWWIPGAKKIRVKQKYKKPKPLPLDDFVKEVYGK